MAFIYKCDRCRREGEPRSERKDNYIGSNYPDSWHWLVQSPRLNGNTLAFKDTLICAACASALAKWLALP